jgi:hypothetical protein
VEGVFGHTPARAADAVPVKIVAERSRAVGFKQLVSHVSVEYPRLTYTTEKLAKVNTILQTIVNVS